MRAPKITEVTAGAQVSEVERLEIRGVPEGGTFVAVDPPRIVSEVEYEVEARRVEDGRVQLMLRSDDDESVLATFTERPDDVAALDRDQADDGRYEPPHSEREQRGGEQRGGGRRWCS